MSSGQNASLTTGYVGCSNCTWEGWTDIMQDPEVGWQVYFECPECEHPNLTDDFTTRRIPHAHR